MQTLWTFHTRNFRVELACEPESYPDLSWCDPETQDEIDRGLLECLVYRVRITGPGGAELGTDYLGGCVYRDAGAFRGDGYFRDMVREAVTQARRNLYRLQALPVREAA